MTHYQGLSSASSPPEILNKTDVIQTRILFLVFISSGFVMREPAPYDVLMLGLMGLSLLTGLRIPRGLGVMATLLVIFFVFDLVGTLSAFEPERARMHAYVTIYLGITTLFFACLIARDSEAILRKIFLAYTLGAMITALAGIIGYFGNIELLTLYGRAKGLFKDPNVFGPFLIPPALFAIKKLINSPLKRAWPWLMVLGVLMTAVLLSFSRAAWGHFILSSVLMICMMYLLTADRHKKRRILNYISMISIMAVILIMVLVSMKSVGGLFSQRLSFTQSYDIAENGGRFYGYWIALKTILVNPFGVGPLSFAKIYGADPHNVYLQTALTAGWFGGLAYLVLVVITIKRGFHFLFRKTPVQELFFVCYATFLPLAIEGLIIDTDHWRHFYLLLGLIWGLMATYPRLEGKSGRNRAARSAPVAATYHQDQNQEWPSGSYNTNRRPHRP